MAISASRLRQVVYRLLDEVLRTGQPLEIERHGQVQRISAAAPRPRGTGCELLTADVTMRWHLPSARWD